MQELVRVEEEREGQRCLPHGDQDLSWSSVPCLPLGQVVWLMGAGRLSLGGIRGTGWILEPQWGPEKFSFISVFLPRHLFLSLSASHCP